MPGISWRLTDAGGVGVARAAGLGAEMADGHALTKPGVERRVGVGGGGDVLPPQRAALVANERGELRAGAQRSPDRFGARWRGLAAVVALRRLRLHAALDALVVGEGAELRMRRGPDGILRVGGRCASADLPQSTRQHVRRGCQTWRQGATHQRGGVWLRGRHSVRVRAVHSAAEPCALADDGWSLGAARGRAIAAVTAVAAGRAVGAGLLADVARRLVEAHRPLIQPVPVADVVDAVAARRAAQALPAAHGVLVLEVHQQRVHHVGPVRTVHS